jgi:hypothetical protein
MHCQSMLWYVQILFLHLDLLRIRHQSIRYREWCGIFLWSDREGESSSAQRTGRGFEHIHIQIQIQIHTYIYRCILNMHGCVCTHASDIHVHACICILSMHAPPHAFIQLYVCMHVPMQCMYCACICPCNNKCVGGHACVRPMRIIPHT